MLKLYNSLGRNLQDFVPMNQGEVKMYTCGPTVWNYAHIGNFRTFVFEDLLRRYLRFKGYRVFQVMNITDVEDKIIKGIRESHKPLKEHTRFYEAAFMADLESLRVERADLYPRATEHIPEMVSLVRTLMEKGFAYRAPDGSIYFSVSKFKNYGALSGVRLDSLKPAGRVASDHYEEKLEAADFALWKAWDNEDGEVFWDTELGRGRPGWSIECSAMSMKYLGETIDIHTGGLDHIPIHHENEIAQSESATGHPFVRYFVHNAFLVGMEGAKISKSAGRFPVLDDLVAAAIDPLAFRLLCFGAKYRSELAFNLDAVRAAAKNLGYLQEFTRSLPESAIGADDAAWAAEYRERFHDALNNDLNTPVALAVMLELVAEANRRQDPRVWHTLNEFDQVVNLGLAHELRASREEATDARLQGLLEQREAARQARDYQRSDDLRREIEALGWEIKDTKEGPRITRRRGTP